MVAAGFTLKKIRTAQTLGEKLRRARKRLGVDLVEAELATKVRAKYLEALENGDFELLPNEIYVKGFLFAYTNYLGLEAKKMEELYDMETLSRKTDNPDVLTSVKPVKERSLVVTPKLLIVAMAIVFCLSAVVYIIFQVIGFASVPSLAINSPSKDVVIEDEAVKVSGQTDPGVKLKINKESISVASDGSFQQEVSLQNGINTIIVSAVNKANKEAIKTLVVERKIKTAELK